MHPFSLGSIVIFLLYCIVCGVIAKHINESKGYVNGFMWGAFLGIIGIIIVACKPNNNVSSSALETLKSLTELHDQGVISDEVYEEKKAKLIDQL